MKLSLLPPPLVGAAIAALSLLCLTDVRADCLVGGIAYEEGDSTGHIGLECVNATSYDGSASACGPGGALVDTEMRFTCPDSVPYCMQCGPRGWGAALCLSTPDLGNRNCPDGDDEEDFLPASTPAPAATATVVLFDQCDNEQDVNVWIDGGEAGREAQSDFCSKVYGSGGCLLDSDCIEACFQEYGYSTECSICFGAIPSCSMEKGCMFTCAADSLRTECQECNAPCVDELKECTGLPEVESAPADDPSKTVEPVDTATAPPTANPTPLPKPEPTPSPVNRARTSTPTSKPSPGPTVGTATTQTASPTPKPIGGPAVFTRPPTTRKPTDAPAVPNPDATSQPTGSPTTRPTRPPPIPKTDPPTSPPSWPPTFSPVIPPAPVDNSRGGENAAASGSANFMAAIIITTGLLAAVIY